MLTPDNSSPTRRFTHMIWILSIVLAWHGALVADKILQRLTKATSFLFFWVPIFMIYALLWGVLRQTMGNLFVQGGIILGTEIAILMIDAQLRRPATSKPDGSQP